MPKTGSKAARAGIYRCTYCGEEVTIRKGGKLPPCRCGNASWRVSRATTAAPKKKAAAKKKRTAKGRKKNGGWFDSIFG